MLELEQSCDLPPYRLHFQQSYIRSQCEKSQAKASILCCQNFNHENKKYLLLYGKYGKYGGLNNTSNCYFKFVLLESETAEYTLDDRVCID